jgi:nucleoside-diphosphate-sugar epimerase
MFSEHPLYLEDMDKTVSLNIDWNFLKDKKILITGASGLIGTFLCDVLFLRNKIYNDNISIYALGRNKNKIKEKFGSCWAAHNFFFIEHDLLTPLEIKLDIDYIIHCSSNTHPIAYAQDPINTILLSVDGTKNILDFGSRNCAQRMLFLSTVEIYGENRGDTERFDEKYCGYLDCNTLRAGYPEGKRAAEALCQAYIHEKRLDIIIARCCRVFGPTMNNDDSKAIAQFLKNAIKSEDIILKSKGEQQYSYCYVADICSALFFLLLNGKRGEAYNISNPICTLSLFQIARILSSYANKNIVFENPSMVESAGYSKANKALLDTSKIYDLGWKANYSIEEGLIRTIEILRNSR